MHVISIHALREESDLCDPHTAMLTHISIHALREESDHHFHAGIYLARYISIHALREESDSIQAVNTAVVK